MPVTVDSQPLPTEQLGFLTVGDVLAYLQDKNRLVTNVLIDGQSPDFGRIPALRGSPLAGHSVFIETSAPREIALEVLTELERQMDIAEVSRSEAIAHLSRNEPNKALQKLSGCFTTWQTGQESVQKVAQLLRIDLDKIRNDHQTLSHTLDAFAGQLRTIRQSLEDRDYVTLSDTLEYEVTDSIRQWRGAVDVMRQLVS